MFNRLPSLSCSWIGLGLLALGFLSGSATGQPGRVPVILPPEGSTALKQSYLKIRSQFAALCKGTEPFNKDKAEDMQTVDLMAQWYAYRFTWTEFQNKTGEMNGLYEELAREVNTLPKATNPQLAALFLKQLTARLREVLPNEKLPASLNAARCLVRLVEAGSEEAAEALAETLKDPRQNDGAKYWALIGLNKQLGLWAQAAAVPEPPPLPPDRKAKEARYAQILIDAIGRKPPKDVLVVTPEETEGLRVLRREAVRALAQLRNPGITDEKGVLSLRTAQTLLRVAANESLNPEARLDEQLEAGIGVARMQARLLPAYQPDYAAYNLGQFAAEFVRRAGLEPPQFPWKFYAARFSDALETMRDDLKDFPDKNAAAYVGQLVIKSLPVLKEVETNGKGDASDLKVWLGTNPPPNTTLYKGVADSAVKPLDRENPTPPEKPAKPAKPR
jgi:hypothetical protein